MKNNYWSYFKQNWSNSRPFQIATVIWLIVLIYTLFFERENSIILFVIGFVIFLWYCLGCYINMKEQNQTSQ